MAPKAKKIVANAKASSKPAKSNATGSKDERWVSSKREVLATQREAAVKRGDIWVEEHHTWHEERLAELLELLGSGVVTSVPEDVRDSVDFYVSQLTDVADITEESFYDDRDMYGELLIGSLSEQQAPYTRLPETPESEVAIQKLRGWTETHQQGMDKFSKLMREHFSSAGVAEAAVSRITALVAEHKDNAGTSAAQGLEPKAMLQLVADTMHRFPRDADVQAQGCKAILSLARNSGKGSLYIVLEAGGAKLWVEALRAHLSSQLVASIVTKAFAYLLQNVATHSPEWAMLCSSGAEQVLTDVIPYHLTDPQIDKAARTSIPLLRG
eukprot:TRINITY_DN62762_c0_g1_i1.p1 TRINITY_DN62762_c0_g1~~TRINITY_DN62762_c0_g1_i1.p1  ORF type:complete len:326 (+),score=46.13 TRINITY_DN62762_c0_g1_i1:53-1030(+)